MMKSKIKKAPSKSEKIKIRALILFGVVSLVNFFYWFLDFELIENQVLYWMLMGLIGFDTFRLIYIWYHYWNISVPVKPISHNLFSVDVLTTYFPGEPKNMLKETLLAIKQMDYPHTTFLCDEANDADLIEFCRLNDIVHVTRTNRVDAKAGNINNALRQATGDICLILDPDHIPHKNFLTEVIPYFEDPKIGFVQTVQTYYNLNESLVARAAAEQTFHFYGPVMMCMNSYGTVNAIGANCVFRRSALDSIGGHAAGLSEDMHTAMRLHAEGWTSIYVPQVLSQGLAPATLTSYFKQQLKWSRGTLELLVSSFPKLFNKLTWRQKLHYGLLPLHYLTGLIFLTGILIPIIALFTSTSPWKGNVINYGLILIPVIVSILGIRFFVQKWVINKGERGMHLLGGLLMQITWSIYLMGLFYTIIRKKVPYLPTVKEDDQKTSFLIVLPNLGMGLVCIIAIVYGLYRDFTPFSIFMSGFALWNAMIMFYTLHFAYQFNLTASIDRKKLDAKFNQESKLERLIFKIWQKSALFVIAFVLISAVFYNYKQEQTKLEGMIYDSVVLQKTKYVGVFAPVEDNGMSDLTNVSEFSKAIKQDIDIVSFYLAWDASSSRTFPENKLKQVYQQKALPMITWEPWINSFSDQTPFKGHVFDSIISGYFDEFIAKFAMQIKDLDGPVFLRFAHEFDNPFYQWYDDRDNAAENFKKSWIHVWNIFHEQGASNVIWVYNPWKPEHVASSFPGYQYVDWVSVNLLNYATQDQHEAYNSFKSLYEPYHDEFEKLENIPVMLSEFGTYYDPIHQKTWLENAMDEINRNYKNINAIVYFNSKVDNNMPDGSEGDSYLDWTIADVNTINLDFKEENIPSYLFEKRLKIDTVSKLSRKGLPTLMDIRGVNMKNGQKWDQDYHVLTRSYLESNFRSMKDLGLNTINYTSNGIYDYNITTISKEFGLNLSLGFWIPEQLNFVEDSLSATRLKDQIIDLISRYNNYDHIVSWHLQNDLFSKYAKLYNQPKRSFHFEAYTLWLQQLTSEIREVDSTRPIIIDYEINDKEVADRNQLLKSITNLDGLGIIINDTPDPKKVLEKVQSLSLPYIFTDISVPSLQNLKDDTTVASYYIRNWQDQHQIGKLTFDGLIDRKGRNKQEFYTLKEVINPKNAKVRQQPIRILKRLELIYSNSYAYYYAMIYDPITGWTEIDIDENLNLEWTLVQSDSYGNYINIKEVGVNSFLILDIPENFKHYRLQLSLIKGKKVQTTLTTLNTPYYRE